MACWRGVKYQLPTSIDGCPWKVDGTHTSIFPSTACCLNMSSIACIDWMVSLNLGDERPVSIMDCHKYGCLLGCLLWCEWVILYDMTDNTYTLNGLCIGGSSQLHTTPWMWRRTSLVSESSDSWTPNFQHCLPPVFMG